MQIDQPQRQQPKQLEVSGLGCVRDDQELFGGLGFRLGEGQVLLVEGRNGCGKTTLLRILCGIRMQDAGTVHWCDRSIKELGPSYHEQLAYVGHHDGIKYELTVAENVRLARALGKPSTRSMEEILRQVQLLGYDDVLARSLSAGQRRRLALSRLLATDADLWILDEPFTSLDRDGIGIFEKIMTTHVSNNGLIVMSSHHSIELSGVEVVRLHLNG